MWASEPIVAWKAFLVDIKEEKVYKNLRNIEVLSEVDGEM